MTIIKTSDNNNIILTLSGRLDTVTSNQLSDELDKIFQSGSYNIKLDFNSIDYISSAGLRIVINAQKKINSTGMKLELTGVKGTVKEIFDMTGFSSILNIS